MAKCKKDTFKVNTSHGHGPTEKAKKGKRNAKLKVTSNQKSNAEIMNWEKKDKETLLLGLKVHSERNLGAIFQMLPHLPPEDIKKQVAVYSALAEHLYEDKLIDNWLASGMCKQHPLADAMYFIALLENHPPSSSSKEINFRNIYKLIYEMFNGTIEATKLIKSGELKLLFVILDNLDKAIWPKSMNDLFDYLGRNYKRRHIQKVYKGKKVCAL